jgi:hypothetical protein
LNPREADSPGGKATPGLRHAMPVADGPLLLFGPYRPPPLKRGDRAVCLARDADVVVTGISAGHSERAPRSEVEPPTCLAR